MSDYEAYLDSAAQARISELEAELRNRCDHCGARTIDMCYVCGAPQCCPQCCKIQTLEAERDAERERAEQFATQCDRLDRDVARLTAERDALKEQLIGAPGTPLGRWKFLCEWASNQPWCIAYSSRGWEGQMIEHLDALKAENERLREAIKTAPCPVVALRLWNMTMDSRELLENGLCDGCDCWKSLCS